jgi:SPP1 family predicted phage head-tail adaptor
MPDKLGSGDLDRRITILVPQITFNEFNEPVETFVTLMAVSAKRLDVSASEAFRAQEIGAELTARFTIRWSARASAIDARHRVRSNGKDYNITGIREREDRERWLEIDAVVRAETAVDYDSGSP